MLLVAVTSLEATADEAEFWSALRSGGHVVMMRHALAPGTGDPSEFDLDDCGTQRNLSDQGRSQAERIGDRFRANGFSNLRVLSSEWCRCLETAALLNLGRVEKLSTLNSFFREPDLGDQQTQAMRVWLSNQDPDEPLVMVTHQVNISALTGVYPGSGELVLVRLTDPEITVVGRLRTD